MVSASSELILKLVSSESFARHFDLVSAAWKEVFEHAVCNILLTWSNAISSYVHFLLQR